MKNTFLKKLVNLLEKEVCQEELPKELPAHLFKTLQLDKKDLPSKPINVASRCLKNQETVLSEGVCVKGELHFEKQLRINGCFEGSLKAKGKVIVGPNGSIKGDISLDEAEIHGKVFGNVHVNKLHISATGHVIGDIHAHSVDIQQGAQIHGHLQISRHVVEIEEVLQNLG